MNPLVLHPTIEAQWHALVNEAERFCALRLPEDVEQYLVGLLVRFIRQPQLAESVVALDFLNAASAQPRMSGSILRDTGDKCLLYSGLFPGLAQRRRVRVSYFVHIGQASYTLLAEEQWGRVFLALCDHFIHLMDMLQVMRELADNRPHLTPLQAAELYEDTGSEHALLALKWHTGGEFFNGMKQTH